MAGKSAMLALVIATFAVSGCFGGTGSTSGGDDADRTSGASDRYAYKQDDFEPVTYSGTVSGGADCILTAYDQEPLTPGPVHDLPANATGRIYKITATLPGGPTPIGATCLWFDGSLGVAGGEGLVPQGATFFQVVTNFAAQVEYRVNIA